MEVQNLKRGQLFKLEHQREQYIYEFVDNPPPFDDYVIKRVAFYSDGRWVLYSSQQHENCNPYCPCVLVTVEFPESL